MVDIREVWPDIPDECIEVFPRLTPRQWFLVGKMWSQGRIENAEVSEDDLLHGFLTSDKGAMQSILVDLVGLSVIRCFPKLTAGKMYSANAHHEIFSHPGTSIVFLQARINREFREALLSDEVEIVLPAAISERQLHAMTEILRTSMQKKEHTHLIDYDILGPTESKTVYGYGARIRLILECPLKRKSFELTVEVESAQVMFQRAKEIPCPRCGNIHHVKLAGRLEY